MNVAVARAETLLHLALAEHGDFRWEWNGERSNPDVVPVMWNNIRVIAAGGGTRILPAQQYVDEVSA